MEDIYGFDDKASKDKLYSLIIMAIIVLYFLFCTTVFLVAETKDVTINLQTITNNEVNLEEIFEKYPDYLINPLKAYKVYSEFDEVDSSKSKKIFAFFVLILVIVSVHLLSKKNNKWKNIEHGSASWATYFDRKKYKLDYKFEFSYKIKPLMQKLIEIKKDIFIANIMYKKQKDLRNEKVKILKEKEKKVKEEIQEMKQKIKNLKQNRHHNINEKIKVKSINKKITEEDIANINKDYSLEIELLKKQIDRPYLEKILIEKLGKDYSKFYFSNIKYAENSKFLPNYNEIEFTRNIILSDTEFLPIDDRAIFRNLNILVVGGSGAGKSRNFVKPNILAASLNMVLTDPKGELYQDTHEYLEQAGYKTYQLNLNELEKSTKYNPFKYIRKDSDINIMVDTIIRNTNEKGNTGDFWEKSEKALFMALAHYLYQEYKEKIGNNLEAKLPTLRNILTLVTELRDLSDVEKTRTDFQFLKYEELPNEYKIISEKLNYKYRYKDEIERTKIIKEFILSDTKEWEVIEKNIETCKYEIRKVPVPIIAKLKVISEFLQRHPAKVFFDTYNLGEEKVKSSIKISLAVRLAFIGDEALSNLVSDDEFDLDNVEEKRAIFVIISDSNSAFNSLAGLFFSQLFQVLYFNADKRPNKRLPLHYQFYLDEFANIGQINGFSEILATCRGRRIGIVPIVQALSQLEKLYEKNAPTIQGNCDTLLYLGGNDVETMEKISKMIGNTTVDAERQSQGRTFGNSASSSRNDNINATGRPLITPDEIKKLPDSKSIIMIRGFKPFLSNKLNVDEYYKELEIMKYVRKFIKNKNMEKEIKEEIKNKEIKEENQVLEKVSNVEMKKEILTLEEVSNIEIQEEIKVLEEVSNIEIFEEEIPQEISNVELKEEIEMIDKENNFVEKKEENEKTLNEWF